MLSKICIMHKCLHQTRLLAIENTSLHGSTVIIFKKLRISKFLFITITCKNRVCISTIYVAYDVPKTTGSALASDIE